MQGRHFLPLDGASLTPAPPLGQLLTAHAQVLDRYPFECATVTDMEDHALFARL